jgi:hypothetical protein
MGAQGASPPKTAVFGPAGQGESGIRISSQPGRGGYVK